MTRSRATTGALALSAKQLLAHLSLRTKLNKEGVRMGDLGIDLSSFGILQILLLILVVAGYFMLPSRRWR